LATTLLKSLSVTTIFVIINLQLCQWKGLWSFQIHLITVKEDHKEVQSRERVAQSILKPTVYVIPILSVTYTSGCFVAMLN